MGMQLSFTLLEQRTVLVNKVLWRMFGVERGVKEGVKE
jgi:hypothetical protein